MNHGKLVRPLLNWFAHNARDLPWRRGRDPYAIWVSEVMLQQTQVKTVIPYWERWMRALPNIAALAQADSAQLHKLWEGLGYYSRVRNMHTAAQVIMQEHAGRFPREYAAVLNLPGIGPYTAGAICSIAFNQPRPVLDGNVIRVLTRVFGIGAPTRKRATQKKLWALSDQLVHQAAELEASGQNACSRLNQSLMELGALTCTPGQPGCERCPLTACCVAWKQNRTMQLPNLGERPAATSRRFVAVVVECQGRFLVRQRPARVVNAHLWEFPNIEIEPGRDQLGAVQLQSAAHQALGFAPARLEPLCSFKHAITRYRITLEVFRAKLDGAREPGRCRGQWLGLVELDKLAFASAHRKVLELFRDAVQPLTRR